MKAKPIIPVVVLSLCFIGAVPSLFGGQPVKKSAPWNKKVQPPKGKNNPSRPAVKPRQPVLQPTLYSGRALAVNLTNAVTGQSWRLADTGPLPPSGGSLSQTVGATTLDNSLYIEGAAA